MEDVFRIQGLNRPQDLRLLVADGVRLKRHRGFHSGEAQQLHDVIGNHVAQRARRVKVSAALFHADRLSIGNLHVIDVSPVPYWLEDGIIEAKDHDVLHGLFTQVMIDAINLVFRQH